MIAGVIRGRCNGKRMNNDRGRACGGFISLALVPKTTCRSGPIPTPNLSAGNVGKRVRSTRIWRAAPRTPSPPLAHPWPTPGLPGRAAGRGAWRSGRARDGTAIPVAGAAGGVWRSARGIGSPGWHAHGHTTTPPGPPPGAAPRTPPPAGGGRGGGLQIRVDWPRLLTLPALKLGVEIAPHPIGVFPAMARKMVSSYARPLSLFILFPLVHPLVSRGFTRCGTRVGLPDPAGDIPGKSIPVSTFLRWPAPPGCAFPPGCPLWVRASAPRLSAPGYLPPAICPRRLLGRANPSWVPPRATRPVCLPWSTFPGSTPRGHPRIHSQGA